MIKQILGKEKRGSSNGANTKSENMIQAWKTFLANWKIIWKKLLQIILVSYKAKNSK